MMVKSEGGRHASKASDVFSFDMDQELCGLGLGGHAQPGGCGRCSGLQYAAAEFQVTYLGSTKGFPGSDLDVAFVTQEGTTHKQFDVSVVGPDSLSSENELYEGGSVTGVVYIAIPMQDADQGTWRISQFLNDSEFFFKAQ